MHHAIGRWEQHKHTMVDLNAIIFGKLTFDEIYHPLERDIGKTRFIFGIAAADVRVIAREPNLLKCVGLPWARFRKIVTSPLHSGEVLSVLVYRHRVASEPNGPGEVQI